MKIFKLFMVFVMISCALSYQNDACAKKTVEKIGDYMQVIVPAYAFGMAMNEEDWDGAKDFAYSFGAMEASVYGLKYVVKERRPNKADNRSFPSGHTASAFSGASFIHKRYGIKRAVVPYLMSGFTAYSRIAANKHYWWDALAGAAIATGLSFAIVDKKHSDTDIVASPEYIGFRTRF